MRTHHPSLIDRMRRHQIALGAVTGIVALVVAVLAAMSTNGLPLVPAYELEATLPPGAPTLRTGAEARIAGTSAGVITDVTATPDGRQRLRFKLRTHPVGRDASITVRLKSPAGGRYLDVDRGTLSGPTMASGDEIPLARIRFTEDLPTVFEDFSRSALEESKHAIGLAGNGVLGRGPELNRALDGVDTTVAGGTKLLRAMAPGDDLPGLTSGLGVVARAFGGRSQGDAARFTTASADTLGELADRRTALGGLLAELPPTEARVADVLPKAEPLLGDTARLTRRLRPAVAALRRSLPAVNRLLGSAPTLATEVPRLTAATEPALRALVPVLRLLGPSSVLLGRAFEPISGLAGYLARYPVEITSGIGAYYAAWMYRPPVGLAPGAAVAPSLLVLTCAVASAQTDPPPGQFLGERLDKPCR